MTAMELLDRCRKAPEDLDNLMAQLRRLRERAEGMNGMDMERVGPPGTGETDRMAAFAADIEAVEQKMLQRNKERLAEERAACRVIAVYLPAITGEIMYHYYLNGFTIRAIAAKGSYNECYARKLKARGDGLIRAIPPEVVAELLPEWYRKEAPMEQEGNAKDTQEYIASA